MIIGDIYIELPTSLSKLDVCSIYYLLFILLVFFVSRPFKSKLRPYTILLASVFFIYTYSIYALIVLSVISIVGYAISLLVNKCNSWKPLLLLICPFVLTLLFFKYYGLIGLDNIIFPLGISYYSLKIISYLVDVYKGNCLLEKNIIYYLDYVMFFPCLTAGPINRAQNFFEELRSPKEFDYKFSKGGGFQVMLGIFEKMVMCDFVSYVNNLISGNAELTGINVLISVFLYSFEIYLNFDAISNIALGSAKLFGFDLGRNFYVPYLSSSLMEFWRRWHISLNAWLKDYIYIPLGGSRKGNIRKYLNIIVVFLVSGIWHGNTINFIIWGLLNAIIQIVESEVVRHIKVENKIIKTVIKIIGICFNFVVVSFLWLIFKNQTIAQVVDVINLIKVKQAFDYTLIGLTRNEFYWLIVIIIITIISDVFRYNFDMIDKFNKLPFFVRWLIYAFLIVIFLVFGVYGGSFDPLDFIYEFF